MSEADELDNSGLVAIYCIASDDGFIKVGISSSPYARFLAIQTGNHRPLRIAHLSYVRDAQCDPAAIEREIHDFLKPRHARGEWFFATLDHYIEALDVVQYRPGIFWATDDAYRRELRRREALGIPYHGCRLKSQKEARQ